MLLLSTHFLTATAAETQSHLHLRTQQQQQQNKLTKAGVECSLVGVFTKLMRPSPQHEPEVCLEDTEGSYIHLCKGCPFGDHVVSTPHIAWLVQKLWLWSSRSYVLAPRSPKHGRPWPYWTCRSRDYLHKIWLTPMTSRHDKEGATKVLYLPENLS